MLRRELPFLDQLAPHDYPRVGGKASHLAQLLDAGVQVPPGFCIPNDYFQSFVSHHRLMDQLSDVLKAALRTTHTAPHTDSLHLEAGLTELRAQVLSAELPPAFHAVLEKAWQRLTRGRLGPGWKGVAVRSSGAREDSREASFAGQYDSVLNVRSFLELSRAVKKVWASFFSDRAVRYRLQRGQEPSTSSPGPAPVGKTSQELERYDLGVVVQILVEPEVSGVLFTLNPVSGSHQEMLIEAGYGLGEAFVSGQLSPDAFFLSRQGRPLQPDRLTVSGQRLSHKAERLVSTEAGDGSLTFVPVLEPLRDRPALTSEQLLRLGEAGLRIEALFHCPQDIEWALDTQGQLFILQARPITTTQGKNFQRQTSVLWTRRFFGERWTEPATPLGWSMLEPILDHFIRFDGVSKRFLHNTPPTRLVQCHPYFNVTIFRHLVWKFRGYAPPQFILEFFPREEQEEMLSAPYILPNMVLVADILQEVVRTRRWRRYHYNFLTNHRAWDEFVPGFLRAIEAMPDDSESAEEARALMGMGADWVREYVRIHLLSLLFANLYYQLLAGQLRRWLGEHDSQLLSELVAWPGENKTLETNRALASLTDVVRTLPAIRARLTQEGPLPSLSELQSLPGGEVLEANLQVFLKEYGHRASASWEIFSPRWADAPELVVQMVASLLKTSQTLRPESLESQRMQARSQAELLLWTRLGPLRLLKRMALRHVLASTRAYLVLRENQRFYFDKLLLKIKRAAEGLGEHWHKAGILEQPDDVVFLTLQELDDILSGSLKPARVQALVRERRQDLADARDYNPPAFLEGDDTLVPVTPEAGRTLSGLGISPGRVTGTVRVLHSWQEMDKLQQGDILVARATDPSWTFLFMTAGGLITELGSLLSHGAVVAREYKLPAVVNIPDATRILQDGQKVTLDGFRGVVYLQ